MLQANKMKRGIMKAVFSRMQAKIEDSQAKAGLGHYQLRKLWSTIYRDNFSR